MLPPNRESAMKPGIRALMVAGVMVLAVLATVSQIRPQLAESRSLIVASTTTVTASQDTFVATSSRWTNTPQGHGRGLFVGEYDPQDMHDARIIVQFDLGGDGGPPANARILGATLQLYLTFATFSAGNETLPIEARLVQEPWYETTTTYGNMPAAGEKVDIGATTVGTTVNQWVSWPIEPGRVKPQQSISFMLMTSSNPGRHVRNFLAKEYEAGRLAPRLVIEWNIPTATPTPPPTPTPKPELAIQMQSERTLRGTPVSAAATVSPGEELAYTLTVSNTGRVDLSSIVISNTLPVQATLVATPVNSEGLEFQRRSRLLRWELAALPIFGTVQAYYRVRVQTPRSLRLTVSRVSIARPEAATLTFTAPVTAPTSTPSATLTITPTASATATATPTATVTATVTATGSPSPTQTSTESTTTSPTVQPSPSPTNSPTDTATATSTATETPTATFTPTPTATDTATATASPTASRAPGTIAVARLETPASFSVNVGEAVTVYGHVLAPGVTEPPDPGPGMRAEPGYGPAGSDPALSTADWTFSPAEYDSNVSIVNPNDADRYRGVITPTLVGSFDLAYRFSLYGGPWVYADSDSSLNGYSPDQAGRLAVLRNVVKNCAEASSRETGRQRVLACAIAGGYQVFLPLTGKQALLRLPRSRLGHHRTADLLR